MQRRLEVGTAAFRDSQNGPWHASSPPAGYLGHASDLGSDSIVVEIVAFISSSQRFVPDTMRPRPFPDRRRYLWPGRTVFSPNEPRWRRDALCAVLRPNPVEQTCSLHQSLCLGPYRSRNVSLPIVPLDKCIHRSLAEAKFNLMCANGHILVPAWCIFPQYRLSDGRSSSGFMAEGGRGREVGVLLLLMSFGPRLLRLPPQTCAFIGDASQPSRNLLHVKASVRDEGRDLARAQRPGKTSTLMRTSALQR